MAQLLPGFPQSPRHRYTTTLGDVQLEFEYTWYPRLESWHVTVRTRDGEPIARGLRLAPGAAPLHGRVDDRLPDGVFLVAGPSEYGREALGETLGLVYVPADEVELPEADGPLEVTV
jgi:hypothetical protein